VSSFTLVRLFQQLVHQLRLPPDDPAGSGRSVSSPPNHDYFHIYELPSFSLPPFFVYLGGANFVFFEHLSSSPMPPNVVLLIS